MNGSWRKWSEVSDLSCLRNFTLMVDHQAVVAILDKYTLDAIENPKIQRLKQRLSPYSFTSMWRRGEGKCHSRRFITHSGQQSSGERRVRGRQTPFFYACCIPFWDVLLANLRKMPLFETLKRWVSEATLHPKATYMQRQQ